MPTIYDVASKAGVSITTVSRVLNGSGRVSQKTRERVEQVMQELNYIPSPSARSLNLGISRIIALVVPDISNPFYAEVARGVQDVCDRQGYNVFISSTDGRGEKERLCIEGVMQQRVDGVCIVRHRVSDDNLRLLVDAEVPTVAIGAAPEGVPMDNVGIFGTGAALKEIVTTLVRHGRRRLAHIGGPSYTSVGVRRRAQFEEMVAQFELGDARALFVESDFTVEGGRIAASRLLHKDPSPDMIFAANDTMAIGVLQAAESAGLKVPDDVAVFGCDDIQVASLLRPSLTTVRLPKYELGQQAANVLFDRIANRDQGLRTVSLEARVVHRESTDLESAQSPRREQPITSVNSR